MKTILTIALLFPTAAFAVECPPDMKQGCKVLFLSPEEVQILTQPNGILATAADARKLDYQGAVQFFLNKIKEAPQGEVPKDQVAPPEKTQERAPMSMPDKK